MKKAQVLVEIVIAIGVTVIALLSISRISSRSIYNTGSATRQNAATSYASTAINIVKSMIYNQLGTQGSAAVKANSLFAADVNGKCFDGSQVTSASGFCAISGTDFEGKITMQRATINFKDELTVVAEVRWIEGNLTRNVKNEAKIVLDQ